MFFNIVLVYFYYFVYYSILSHSIKHQPNVTKIAFLMRIGPLNYLSPEQFLLNLPLYCYKKILVIHHHLTLNLLSQPWLVVPWWAFSAPSSWWCSSCTGCGKRTRAATPSTNRNAPQPSTPTRAPATRSSTPRGKSHHQREPQLFFKLGKGPSFWWDGRKNFIIKAVAATAHN